MTRRNPAFESLEVEYADLYKTMKIKPSWVNAVTNVSNKIKQNRDRYEAISKACGGNIPWYFIGVIHNLECGLSFSKHLHNGDSLKRKTRRVPAGRPLNQGNGPFDFDRSAVDALTMKGFQNIVDWSPARMCFELEKYNGFGYRLYHPSTLSPYLWSGSTHYTKGKYVSDGKWSSAAVSQQLGAILVIAYLRTLDKPATESTKFNVMDKIDKIVPVSMVTTGVFWSTLQQVRTFMQDNAGMITLSIGLVVVALYLFFRHRSAADLKDGRYMPSGLVANEEEMQDVE